MKAHYCRTFKPQGYPPLKYKILKQAEIFDKWVDWANQNNDIMTKFQNEEFKSIMKHFGVD